MSDFEYASVVVSIVLAIGIADLLRFLADSFRESGGHKLYWVHLLWILLLLQFHVEFWWRMWTFKELVTVGPGLGLVLLGPALLFVAARALLPSGGADGDMQALYYRRKNLFFVLLALLNSWALLFSPWSAGMESAESMTPMIFMFASVMALFVACIFSSSQILHKIVVSLILVLEVLDMFSAP